MCIYVIDVQDESRIEESLSYLKDVVDEFRKLEINPPIYIFLHKLDPTLKKKKPIETEKRNLDIRNKALEIIGDIHVVEFFKTSIYDLWTVMTAFSKILLAIYPQSELIDKTIKEFAEMNNAKAIIVLDSNSLIIGQHFDNDEAMTILEHATPYFLTLNDSFSGVDESKKMIVERGGMVYFFDEIKLEKGIKPLFLLIMKEENNFDDQKIRTFMNIFRDLIIP